MRCKIFTPTLDRIIDNRHELYLEPENEADELKLETLVRDYETVGMGRHAGTGKVLYVRIAIWFTAHKQAT